MHRSLLLAVPLALSLSGAAYASTAGSSLALTEKEFSIKGVPTTLAHGKKYTVTIKNAGAYPHDLLVDGNGLHDVGIHNKQPIAPGGSASFKLTFPKAGKYHIYCAIPGHASKGMQLTVTVS